MASTHDYKADVRNSDIQIYINGIYFHRSEAKISVMDSGYLLGDGVWEGIRLHKGKFLHLENHLSRLYKGAQLLDIKLNLSLEKVKQALIETVKINNMYTDVHIRLIVSRGIKKTPYQHPKVTVGPPNIVIIPEFKKVNINDINKGIVLVLVKTIRDYRVQNPQINSLSKHNCIAACIEAAKLGADEGIMLDPKNNVSTCNSTNLFIVRKNEVWTSKGMYCLKGVTRGIIINICKENNLKIFEKDFLYKDVESADEVFVTGTFAGVIPVVKVGDKVISNSKIGKITKLLQDYYLLDMEK
ncbi:MAG: aminotransferase class IV [Candidatus Neomarinimicrobiota bacterium]